MKRNITLITFLLFFLNINFSWSQEARYPFSDVELNTKERVEDLLARLTLEEKVAQMQDVAPAISRLGIPEYNWWNECLHGVARAGRATSFPQAIGMAATWNTPLIHQVADAISTEARAKYNASIDKGQRNRYQGLTMWTPNINIFRDPRWGRGQETYGEDPYLTSQMGLAFVTGLQGNDPTYFKAIATPKHFAVHSGPEFNRHSFDAFTSKKDLWETYLPAFKVAVVEGKAFSVMSAYNRYLGESATASSLLLTDILRDKWGFEGYVVSDCGAVADIYRFHKITKTAAEASALAVKAGCDLNCGNSYNYLVKAVKKRLITEDKIDVSLRRLLTARMKLGLFNPMEEQPFRNLNDQDLESEKNQELALQTAKESIVLLKNENNVLPLSKDVNSIAVIGPNANDRHFILGNYFGVPSKRATILEGIKEKVSSTTEVNYFKGVNLTDNEPVFDVIGADNFKGKVKVEYFDNSEMSGTPVKTTQENQIDFNWGAAAPIDILRPGKFSIRYTTSIQTNYEGELSLAVLEQGGSYSLWVNGEKVVTGTSKADHTIRPQKLAFAKGKTYQIQLEFYATNEWMASVQLLWNLEHLQGEAYMMEMAAKSDVIVYVGGITAKLEGEEMPVEIDGFYKGDRSNLLLPKVQLQLLKKLKKLGKPVVFVLTSGSAMAINWEQKNLDAILTAWYPGQAGGAAVADVLFGDYNPSGKLPITFYKSVKDLPDFEDYSMKGRTYRYFEGEVLYPFGYGLSYATFEYSKPVSNKETIGQNETISLSVKVANLSNVDGKTVVQLYVKDLESNVVTPLKSLKKFKKISLKKGESKLVEFTLNSDDLSIVNDEGNLILEPGSIEVFIGESSATANSLIIEVK